MYSFEVYERGLETRIVGTTELGEEPNFDTTNTHSYIVTVQNAQDKQAWIKARNSLLHARWMPNQDYDDREFYAAQADEAEALLAALVIE